MCLKELSERMELQQQRNSTSHRLLSRAELSYSPAYTHIWNKNSSIRSAPYCCDSLLVIIMTEFWRSWGQWHIDGGLDLAEITGWFHKPVRRRVNPVLCVQKKTLLIHQVISVYPQSMRFISAKERGGEVERVSISATIISPASQAEETSSPFSQPHQWILSDVYLGFSCTRSAFPARC